MNGREAVGPEQKALALRRLGGIQGRRLHRLAARDRRKAAIHEAGHLVVARHFGMRSASAYIWKNAPDPRSHMWGGATRFSAADLGRLSTKRAMMFGVAGVVAEEAWELRHATGFGWSDPETLLAEGGMSDTDWTNSRSTECRDAPKLWRAVEDVQILFQPDEGPLWRPLCEAARAILRGETCNAFPRRPLSEKQKEKRLRGFRARLAANR